MNEGPCYKSVSQGEVRFIPVAQIEEVSTLYKACISMQSNPLLGDDEVQALTVLRVFTYNLLASL